jgi:hypothetical protein
MRADPEFFWRNAPRHRSLLSLLDIILKNHLQVTVVRIFYGKNILCSERAHHASRNRYRVSRSIALPAAQHSA